VLLKQTFFLSFFGILKLNNNFLYNNEKKIVKSFKIKSNFAVMGDGPQNERFWLGPALQPTRLDPARAGLCKPLSFINLFFYIYRIYSKISPGLIFFNGSQKEAYFREGLIFE
jgi:hypothetical protein